MKLFLASEFCYSFNSFLPYLGELTGKRVLLIETAAIGENFTPDRKTEIEPFENHGASVTCYDLRGKTKQEVKDVLDETDIVYICGGNTFFLLKYMKNCFFKELLQKRLDDGMIYIGSSAGSVVACPDIEFIAPMDNPDIVNLDNTEGLGLVHLFFVPHLEHETMGEMAQDIADNHKGSEQMLVLKDGQALFVEDNVMFLL